MEKKITPRKLTGIPPKWGKKEPKKLTYKTSMKNPLCFLKIIVLYEIIWKICSPHASYLARKAYHSCSKNSFVLE